MYRLSDLLPSGGPSEAVPGTSILVGGPPFSGQRERYLDLLTAGYEDGEGVVIITTDSSAAAIEAAFDERTGDTERLYVVDARSGATADGLTEVGNVAHVSSPGDLTGIGMKFVQALTALQRQGVHRIRVGLDSISTLIQYIGPAVVFQFLHTLAGRCEHAGLLLVTTLNTAAHDSQTVDLVSAVFDTLVQVRETEDEDRLEARVATQTGPSGWTSLSAA